jgi:hypothetical protein
MAKLFDTFERIVPTWLAAARFLDSAPNRTASNLVLEIADPLCISAADRTTMAKVDKALAPGLTLNTVAGTIFPMGMYKRLGRPAFYAEFLQLLDVGKKRGTWGTYAERMMRRRGRNGEPINPLDILVERLSDAGQPKKNDEVTSYASSYELGVNIPEEDLVQEDVGGEIPTYDVARDGLRWLGFPCLSHVSFKRLPQGDGHVLNMTAIYRSHHYCQRGLGNLLGLAQLLSFVSKESGLKPGTLTCVSSHAVLDVQEWGGVGVAAQILN